MWYEFIYVGLVILVPAAFAETTLFDRPLSKPATPWIPSLIVHGLQNFVPVGTTENSLCTKHGRLYKLHLSNLTVWAVQMEDASSRGPSGLLTGNNYQFGDFDECIKVYEPTHSIRGKYVVAKFIFEKGPLDGQPEVQKTTNAYVSPEPGDSVWDVFKNTNNPRLVNRNTLHWALCVPESCQDDDIEQSLTAAMAPVSARFDVQINSTVDSVFSFSRRQFTTSEDIALVIFIFVTLVMVGLVMTATFREMRQGPAQNGYWLDDMSIITNWQKLWKSDNLEFPVIAGMKTWSMFLIIYGHRMMLSTFSPLFNQEDNEMLVGTLLYTFVRNGALVVNTFLVITGFLTYHKMIRDVNNQKSINVFKFIYHRWIRLTPLYAYVMAFTVVVGPRLSNGGPLGRDVIWDSRCTSGIAWLTQLFYINNYVYPTEQCLIPSWYIATDMQLYIVCATCGYVYWRHRKTGLVVLFVLAGVSVVTPGIVIFQKNYNGVFLFFFDNFKTLLRNSEFVETYMYSHNRASPYILGMVAAYVYHYISSSKRKSSAAFLWTVFLSAIVVHFATWLGAWFFYLPGRPYYLMEHVLYAMFHRVGWSVPICTYIICAAYGRLAPLKYTLGTRSLRPLSTLSYATLLIHTPIQLLLAGSLRSPPYYNFIMSIWMTCGDLVFSYVAATILHLFIEAPLARLKDLRIHHLAPTIQTNGSLSSKNNSAKEDSKS